MPVRHAEGEDECWGRDFITDTILLLSADFGRKGNWGDTLSGKTR